MKKGKKHMKVMSGWCLIWWCLYKKICTVIIQMCAKLPQQKIKRTGETFTLRNTSCLGCRWYHKWRKIFNVICDGHHSLVWGFYETVELFHKILFFPQRCHSANVTNKLIGQCICSVEFLPFLDGLKQVIRFWCRWIGKILTNVPNFCIKSTSNFETRVAGA